MDDLDRAIVAGLLEDARVPFSHLADRLGVANATVHQRFRRLVERGIIQGSRVVVDWPEVGYPVVALINASVSEGSIAAAADRIAEIPYVRSCFASTGEFDLLLVVQARSSEHLGELIEQVRDVASGRSRTAVVLNTFFEGRTPPL